MGELDEAMLICWAHGCGLVPRQCVGGSQRVGGQCSNRLSSSRGPQPLALQHQQGGQAGGQDTWPENDPVGHTGGKTLARG